MSRFGWAYVNNAITGAVANGPTNSIQFNSGSQVLSGSSSFVFDPSTNKVTLLGQLTGSTLVISASVVSASTYLGVSTTPGGANQTIQFNSGSTFSGSSNLVYNYTTNILSGTTAQFTTITGSTVTGSGALLIGGNATIGGSALIGGGFAAKFTTFSSSFTASANNYFIGISTTGSVVTASLRVATQYVAGQTLIFKDVGGYAGTNNVLIKPTGVSDKVDGASGGVLITTNSGSVTLVCDGTSQFYIVATR